jgi:hypothetical protein
MYYSTIILSNIYLQELPEKDEAAWLEKAVLAAIDGTCYWIDLPYLALFKRIRRSGGIMGVCVDAWAACLRNRQVGSAGNGYNNRYPLAAKAQ